MSNNLLTGLLLIFLLNVVGNSLNTLKTIFLAKNIVKPTYLIVFIDGVIFFSSLNQVGQGDSLVYLLAFALGKTAGTWIGSAIENKMALGVVELSLYAKGTQAKKVADAIRSEGYSVTTYKGYGMQGEPGFELSIALNKKELPVLNGILAQYSLDNAAMIMREVSSVRGKAERVCQGTIS